MADFSQFGPITSLHRLGQDDIAHLQTQLTNWSSANPVTLIIPCHADDLHGPALSRILSTLSALPYIRRVILGLDGATLETWQLALQLLTPLPIPSAALWNDGPEVTQLLASLEHHGIPSAPRGKGRNLWLCTGLALALEQNGILLAHDADILTYSAELPARLCWPIAHPSLGFQFCKGFAARFSRRLNGRVMRLLVTPLLRALETLLGPHPLLRYLASFRYPLAGEFACHLSAAKHLRMAHDWGAEISLLAEARRTIPSEAICQAEFAARYDHKHQDLSERDSSRGLHKMAADVATSIFLCLAEENTRWEKSAFDSLLPLYLKEAQQTLRAYRADAEFNGLEFDPALENLTVTTFAHSLSLAAEKCLSATIGSDLLPCWQDIFSTAPDAPIALSQAATILPQPLSKPAS